MGPPNGNNMNGLSDPLAGRPHSDEFKHIPPPATASRAPCPALNSLANHGYISRTGRDLCFKEVVYAINHVYNLSYPFCILLTFGGFITCGNVRLAAPRFVSSSVHGHQTYKRPSKKSGWSKVVDWIFGALGILTSLSPVSWTLDLDRLSERGLFKIAHNASFVHPNNLASTAPDPKLLAGLLAYKPRVDDPISQPASFKLIDIAEYHALRLDASVPKPKGLHETIALGECALAFLVLRGRGRSRVGGHEITDGAVAVHHLEQWFGQERLPEGYWDEGEGGLRPQKTIKILDVSVLLRRIGQLGKTHTSHF